MTRAKFIALCFLAPAIAFGQADTGRPGTVFFVEGAVYLKDVPVKVDPVRPTEVRNEQRLRAEQGNAEMLFALGSFIRLGANSEIEMVDAGLTSATVRLHRGALIIEAFRTWGEDSLKVLAGEYEIAVTDAGEMRIEVPENGAPSVEVLKGELLASSSGQGWPLWSSYSTERGPRFRLHVISSSAPMISSCTWHREPKASVSSVWIPRAGEWPMCRR
jgi:hypothetical protein